MTFEKELKDLINSHSKENDSDTPDFILAQYLMGCLDVFNKTVCNREEWYGREDSDIKETQVIRAVK
jgi:hypothetical protein